MDFQNEERPYTQDQSFRDAYYNDSVLSIKGRIRRSTYCYRILGISLSLIVLLILLVVTIRERDLIEKVLTSFYIIFCFVFTIIQMIKRFHDLRMNGANIILLIVPFYGFYLQLKLLFVEGTVGPNEYGPDPKPRPM